MSDEFSDNQRLISYACAAAALDEGKDLYDSFLLLIEDVLRIIWKKESLPFKMVQAAVNDEYKVNIPGASLDDFLKKLRHRGIIDYIGKNKRSIVVLKEDEDRLSTTNEIRGEVQKLFEDFCTFLLKRDIYLTNEEAKDAVCQLIFKHSHEIADFFISHNTNPISDSYGEYAMELSEFLLECRANNDKNYTAAQRIYKGAVQASLLNISLSKTTALQTDPLPFEHFILDTNFILRILDLQSKHECSMAHETFCSLLELGVDFFVLNETLDEISKSIKSYLSSTEGYTPKTSEYYRKIKLKPSGFDSAISEGKTSKAEMHILSNKANLLDKLKAKGVTLLEDYNTCEETEENINGLIEWKNRREGSNYGESQAIHDLKLIHSCREKRGNQPVNMSNAKWWVMTNDIQLAYWNQDHSDPKECVTEAQVSSILWIGRKKADNSGLVSAIVAVASRDRLSPSQLLTFNKRISGYIAKYKDNSDKCDKLEMVLASGKITKDDIDQMEEDGYDIDQMIDEKYGEIEKNKEKHQLELELSKAEKNKIALQLKKRETEDSLAENEKLYRG